MRCAAIVLALLVAAAAPAAAQDDDEGVKPMLLVPTVPKGGLSDVDRRSVRLFLAQNFEALRPAPAHVAAAVAATKRWTGEAAAYAQPIPDRLERRLAPASDGTFRVLFNRSLLVVRADTGLVIDRVDPHRS